MEVIPFSTEIAREAGSLYISLKKQNQIIEMRDIFIASTALVYALPLFTLNIDHFKRVKGIEILPLE